MRKILIIDDDATSLAIARAVLEDEYVIATARSGQEAMGEFRGENLPDLVLLDVLMPGMSGMEVLSKMKNDERLKDIPVIFLTGERSVKMEIEGYLGGGAGFLLKPVDRILLKLKIKQQLSHIDLQKENRELKIKLGLL